MRDGGLCCCSRWAVRLNRQRYESPEFLCEGGALSDNLYPSPSVWIRASDCMITIPRLVTAAIVCRKIPNSFWQITAIFRRDEYQRTAGILVANRCHDEIADMMEKVYTRDL